MGITSRILCVGLAVATLAAAGAHAETLRIESLVPAQSDEAAALHAIAVDRFEGREGPGFANLIEDRLAAASIDGQPYFTLIHSSQAYNADAILDGEARVRVSETKYTQRRNVCVEEDDKGKCLRREDRELSCRRLSLDVLPRANLRMPDGVMVWSRNFAKNRVLSYCPGYDDEPLIATAVDAAMAEAADEVRLALAPMQVWQDVRVMESRKGMPKPVSEAFRGAIQLTKRNERGACEAFAALEPEMPTHPSLVFNLGLCAEQTGDFDTAKRYYRAALADKKSDDEAQMGIRRIDRTLAAERQLSRRDDF